MALVIPQDLCKAAVLAVSADGTDYTKRQSSVEWLAKKSVKIEILDNNLDWKFQLGVRLRRFLIARRMVALFPWEKYLVPFVEPESDLQVLSRTARNGKRARPG